MQRKICHITTAHPRFDTRIFKKECVSLAGEGFDVSLVIADGLGDQTIEDVKIYDVGNIPGGRLNRFLIKTRLVYNNALSLNADIIHFHDPDFIPYGLKLIRKGKIVIYDVHEDVPKQTYSKEYIPKVFQPLVAFLMRILENYSAKRFSQIITVTQSINERFILLNPNSEIINNYPYSNELLSEINWEKKKNEVAFIGGISEVRGIKQVIESMNYADCTLNLAGEFETQKLKESLIANQYWSKVKYHGVVNRVQLKEMLMNSKIGIVTYLPLPNHIKAQPNKMFEYMSAGIPVVASNFPLWKEIVEGNNCGICVNPNDPSEIGRAISYLLENESIALEMGRNGRKAVIQKYNWDNERKRLTSIYNKLLEL